MPFFRSLALSLFGYLACASSRTAQARSRDSDVKAQKFVWIKPSSGDSFVPGDTINAEWTSKDPIISPSITLCSQEGDDESDCGGTVWPEIKQIGSTFSFSLVVPETTSQASFHLRMKDDFGNIINSPTFSLGQSVKSKGSPSTSVSSSAASASKGDGLNSDGSSAGNGSGTFHDGSSAQTPLNGPTGDGGPPSPPDSGETVSADSSSDRPHPPSGHSIPGASGSYRGNTEPSDTQSQGVGIPIATGKIPTLPDTKSDNSIPSQDTALSRAGLPAAAIAVPISLVGATLLASLGLFIMHRRSLAAQRARNAHLIDIQRNASVRTVGSKVPSISNMSSKSALIDDRDIERAIDALTGRGNRPSSRHTSLRREGSMGYMAMASRYPSPRQDVRRERARTYERDYGWPSDRSYSLRYSRSHSDQYMRSPSPGPIYDARSQHSPLRRCKRSTHARHRRNSTARGNHFDRDRDDDAASSTDSILSGYVSPLISSPRPSRHDSHRAWPRLPPRSHSRQTAPEMEGYHYRHSNDNYDVAPSPHARSHRSW